MRLEDIMYNEIKSDLDLIKDRGKQIFKGQYSAAYLVRDLGEHGIITYQDLVDHFSEHPIHYDEFLRIRTPRIFNVGKSKLQLLYFHLHSLGIEVFEDGYTQEELGGKVFIKHSEKDPQGFSLDDNIHFRSLFKKISNLTDSEHLSKIVTDKIIFEFDRFNIESYQDLLDHYKNAKELGYLSNKKGVRNPGFESLGNLSLVSLYVHLNSSAVQLFRDGYRDVELGIDEKESTLHLMSEPISYEGLCDSSHSHRVEQTTFRLMRVLQENKFETYGALVTFFMKNEPKKVSRGIRIPKIDGVGHRFAANIYTHLHDCGITVFKGGYSPEELGEHR